MNIGLIQTRGLGDIVIAIPAAEFLIEQGHSVFWPIDSRFMSHFKEIFPKINFIAVDVNVVKENSSDYFLEVPKKILYDCNCEQVFVLYSYLGNIDLENERLRNSLTFDAYKYAVTNVPFEIKWNLNPVRNKEREFILYESMGLSKSTPYMVVHREGSNFSPNIKPLITSLNLPVVEITSSTDCLFDWLTVIENSSVGVFVDSVFANLVEQLNLNIPKVLYLRSETKFTPVFKNNWIFK